MKKLLVVIGLTVLSSSVVRAQASSSAEPPNGMSEIAAYSIFYENYKNEEYDAAINYGRWMWKNMPETLKGYSKFELPRNLNRLITCYGEAAKGFQNPSKREAYLDTALVIYDKAFKQLDSKIDPYEWHLSRGRFYQQHSDFIDNAMEKASEDYKVAFDKNAEKLTKASDGYYVQAMLQTMVSSGKKDEALAVIEKAQPYAGSKLKDYFDTTRNKLFDSPKERMAFLKKKVQQNPKDAESIKALRDLYVQQDMNKEAQGLNEKLYKIDPNYENTKALAEAALNNADNSTAIKYLKEALNKTDDAKEKAKIDMKLSDAYLNQEQLQSARTYARKAADANPQWGQPYLQIASVYAQTVSDCTSGRKMTREDKVVYWLVLDYLDKAKSVDSSVANQVQRQYQSYKPVTPTTEDKFFKGWKTGQKMKIDASLNKCYDWVNETTSVR